ncbi:MAG: hypothetical protein GX116_05895 [Fibrobacter sp.]|nr:hypothetical protein [Fibrobacter sp.]
MKLFASHFHWFFSFLLVFIVNLYAIERVVGANASLDLIPGAHSAALGGAILAVDADINSLSLNPLPLSSLSYSYAAFSHVSYFEGTQYDFAAMSIPLGGSHGIAIAFSRFGANDIPWIKEGDPIPESSDYKVLSIADYTFSLAWAKKWFLLDIGALFHGLYRDLDQSGFGFRSDLFLKYQASPSFSLSTLLQAWTSSATRFESGYVEYSSPELYLAAHYQGHQAYFYGKWNLYWQSSGLFHREARDLEWVETASGDRFWESPLDWLMGGRLGFEFVFDLGLSLRVGLASLNTWQSLTFGAGVQIAQFLQLDYAFESHPVLTPVHRVSLSFSPSLFFKRDRGKPKEEVLRSNPELLLQEETDLYEEEEEVGTHWEE